MNSLKIELGKKIRMYREMTNLTREKFCEDEINLTVRQLKRIEGGESLPTLPKLDFIANRLNITISELIEEEKMALPQEYKILKGQLVKFYSYGEKDRRNQREDIFDEIYEKYYEFLPEEEQLAIDVQRSSMDVKHSDNVLFGEGILSEYFFQIKNKQKYSENDLHIIYLYFNCYFYTLDDPETFESMIQKSIEATDYTSENELFILTRILTTVISILEIQEEYEKFPEIILILRTIMSSTQNYYRKPIVDMLEGKYYLFVKQEEENAKKMYLQASQLAKLMEEDILSEKILEEWKSDLEKNL